jgi:hypothetical protein
MRNLIAALALFFCCAVPVAHGQTCPPPAQLQTDLASAAQAAVISLGGVNPLNCPEVSMAQTWTGGKLIFSDSPEKPTTRGKLYYDETLPATSGSNYNRVFLYHVSGYSSGKAKFTVLIKNRGTVNGALTRQKTGTAGPTTSYAYAGKLGYQRWLLSAAVSPVTVTPGAWSRLDSAFDATPASANNLMHGIWDYSFDQPHTVLICVLNSTDDPISVCPTLATLARDSHQRGTFPYADKVYDTSNYTIDSAQGIQQFPVAGNTTYDGNATGTDQTDGTSMTLAGNYGVNYRMHLASSYSDGKKLGWLINPRAGGWGGAIWAMPGLLTGGKFLVPDSSGITSDNTKGSVVGKYQSGHTAPWFQFMPTGGSSFPVRFVVVPF